VDDDVLRDQLLKEVRDELKEIKARISALEGFRWLIVGGIGVITVMIVPLLIDVFIGPVQAP
jgi:hypothetical protein